jgi:mono/diheme cytochrome c family protein
MRLEDLAVSGAFGGATVVALLIALTANATASESDADAVTFVAVNRIFARNCAICHNSAGASGVANLNLEPESSYAAIVSQKASETDMLRIAPGQPERSYLFTKITGEHIKAGGSGGQMPLGMSALSAQNIATIRRWIEQGAKL